MIKETRLLLFKPRNCVRYVGLLVMGLVTVAVGQGTLDDQQAVREFAAANPDIVFMQRVRGQEIVRIVNGGDSLRSAPIEPRAITWGGGACQGLSLIHI